MKILSFLPLLLLIIMGSSCCKEIDECFNSILATTSLESEYGCVNTKYQMEIDLYETYTIIRSQSNFDNLISGSCTPQIDFDKYDLVIGKKGLTSGNVSIEYLLKSDCEKSNLQLFVTFNQNITTEAPNLTYHVLVPKLKEDEVIDILIDIRY